MKTWICCRLQASRLSQHTVDSAACVVLRCSMAVSPSPGVHSPGLGVDNHRKGTPPVRIYTPSELTSFTTPAPSAAQSIRDRMRPNPPIPRTHQSREAAGFLVSVAFVCLAAVRDVYLGGLFQRVSPLLVAMVAFTLCTLVLLPIGLVNSRDSLAVLLRRPRDLFWVNVTSAIAWLAFLYALRLIEPSLVQILYSGIGPLSVVWIDRHLQGASPAIPLTRAERPIYFGLLASLVFAAAVAVR